MPEILTCGEILVEIMRTERDVTLGVPGSFYGPFPSGAPAIFIDQVACLGHSAGIVGCVGNDQFGKRIITRLNMDGVDVSLINIVEDRTTAVAFVSYKKDGSRNFIYHIPHAAAGEVKMPSLEKLQGVKLFHVMGCSLMVNPEMREVINKTAEKVKENGGVVSFDPNIRIELLRGESIEQVIRRVMELCDIILPGEKELVQITGKESVHSAAQTLLSGGIKKVVVKMGKQGAQYIDDNEDIAVESLSVKEVDPTGAGDAFDAGFLAGYLEGYTPEECLKLANLCGAMNASFFGPMEGVFRREFLNYFISKANMKSEE